MSYVLPQVFMVIFSEQIIKNSFFQNSPNYFYSTIALTLCAWIVQSSRYLDMLSQYNISLVRFFKFSSYFCIDIIAVILPISSAILTAIVFYRFVKSNQIINVILWNVSFNFIVTNYVTYNEHYTISLHQQCLYIPKHVDIFQGN